jgi:hypothetical protein
MGAYDRRAIGGMEGVGITPLAELKWLYGIKREECPRWLAVR